MKKRYLKYGFRERLMGTIGILLIVLAIASIFLWQEFGREAFTYEEIIVLKEDIEKNQVIQKDMLGKMRIDETTIIKGAIKDPQEIIGKETRTFLPAKVQLHQKYFEVAGLEAGNGKYIFALPTGWVNSLPGTLRRGDVVSIYTIAKNEESVGKDSSYSGSPITSVKVAFVKDASNREVIDVTPVRMDATAVISNVEIVIDQEQYQLLKRYYENGSQFVLMYQ